MNENEPAERRLEQAAAWRARLAEWPLASRAQFLAWLAQDERNRDAWQRVQAPWRVLGDGAALPQIVRLRQAALAHAQADCGLSLSSRGRRRRVAWAAVAAMIVGLAVPSWLIWDSHRFDTYVTQVGERRVVTLSDGSEIALDSRSEVRVHYGKYSREVALVGGQARFNVTHDVLRPFSVAAAGNRIVATGTSFNVDLLGPRLLVTLLEGRVVVLPPITPDGSRSSLRGTASHQAPIRPASVPTGDSAIAMDAGEQLVLSPRVRPRLTRVNVDHAVAWESGTLVFDDEPLSSVVQRVARYGSRPIVISDATTARLRISGVFHEGDVTGFVSTLVGYLPVRADEAGDGPIRLSAQPVPPP